MVEHLRLSRSIYNSRRPEQAHAMPLRIGKGMGNLDATAATVETVEILLRVTAVLLTGVASLYVWMQLARRRVRPSVIWVYVGAVATATFFWRGVVFLMLFFPELRSNMIEWITPITATMYCLSAVSLILLVFCGSRRRVEDE